MGIGVFLYNTMKPKSLSGRVENFSLFVALIAAVVHFTNTGVLAQPTGLAVVTPPSGPVESTTSDAWADVPGLTATVGTVANSNLKITFTAEASTSGSERMFVRTLIDGQPAVPSDVLFVAGTDIVSRSFTFIERSLGAGVHTVQIQWSVDTGGTAYVGDRTLAVLTSQAFTEDGGLSVVAAPSGPDVTTTSDTFSDIPGMISSVVTAENGNLAITFSAEANTSGSERMFVRALVDGQAAQPSDVVLVAAADTGTRSFTFVEQNLEAGAHTVQIQWLVDAGGTAFAGDRTLSLFSFPEDAVDGGLSVSAAPSGPDVTTTSVVTFVDVPDANATLTTGEGDLVQITFSAEANTSASQRLFLRALVDGQPASPSDLILAAGTALGTRTFTFSADGLTAGMHTVQIQWTMDAGGTGYLGDRTLTVMHMAPQAILPAPSGENAFSYPPTVSPEPDGDASMARPVGVGTVATGGSTLSIMVRPGYFTDPVDMYFGLYSPVLGQDIYLLQPDGSLVPLTQTLVAWKTGTIDPIYEDIFGAIPAALLPSGTYDLYFMVTPQGGLADYYFWATSFVIP
jgi:hypothetical protein